MLGATLAVCVLLYEGVLRRFAPLRVLFGIKTREPPTRESPARVDDGSARASLG